jgi:hypothetical protein
MHERDRLQEALRKATSWEELSGDKPKKPPSQALMRLAEKFHLTDDAEGLQDVESVARAVTWLVSRLAAQTKRVAVAKGR